MQNIMPKEWQQVLSQRCGVQKEWSEESLLPTTSLAGSLCEVVYTHENERGGHFAAWECPESIALDLRVMFGKGEGAYGVVEGRSGYN
jgi:hypothetical protein